MGWEAAKTATVLVGAVALVMTGFVLTAGVIVWLSMWVERMTRRFDGLLGWVLSAVLAFAVAWAVVFTATLCCGTPR